MPGRSFPSSHAARRARFFAEMGKGVALFPAAPVFPRNRDVEHPYRQDSDFFYLTGFDEPEAWLVLDARGSVDEITAAISSRVEALL